MKYFAFILILILNSSVLAQQNKLLDRLTNKQIITQKDLRAAGIQSISGILYLAENWDFFTVDGYERQVSVNGLSPYQRQNFIILLDGQRIDNKIFDIQNINELPVSINQIDYVELISTPQIYEGQFTQSGLIDIRTKKPSEGFSVNAMDGVGDQTGDPGPFVFTKDSTANVDKMGLYMSVNASLNTGLWDLSAATKIEQNFATDPEINNRIANLFPYYNKARMASNYFKLHLKLFGGDHQIILGNTRHYAFYFFQPYGDEIPADKYLKHAGINGSFGGSQGMDFKYSFIYSRNDLGEWDNRQNLDFNWSLEKYSGLLQTSYKRENFKVLTGLGYTRYNVRSPQIKNPELRLVKAFGQIDFQPDGQFAQSAALYVVTDENKTAFKSSIRNYWQVSPAASVTSNFSYSERLFSEDANYWYWYGNGYSFSAPDYFPPNIMGKFGKSKLYSADISFEQKLNAKLKFEAGINFRHFSHYYIEQQVFQFTPDQSTFYAPVEIFPDVNLKTAGARLKFTFNAIPNLTQSLDYIYEKDLWGSPLFREIWKSIPVNKVSYIIDYRPIEDFGIWAGLRYESATEWADYKYSAHQSADVYNWQVKPLLIADASVQKWFWNRRVWIDVLFRNIFNQSEKYIPIGVSNTLRFYLQFQVYFDSLFKL